MPPPWASLSTSALTRRPCPHVQTRTFLRSPPVAMPPLWAWPSTSFLSLCRDPRALSGRRPPVRAQMHSLQSSREDAPRRAKAAAPALRHRRTCLGCSWLCTLRVRLRARASCTRATPLRPARGVPLVPPPPPPRSVRTRDSVGSGPRTRVRVHSVLPSRNQSCRGQWLGSPSRNPCGSEIACPPSGRRAIGVRGRARRKRHGLRGPVRSDGGKFPERARAGAHPPAFRPMLQTGPFDPPQRDGGNRGDSI